jgi:hypothetical protein
MIGDTPFPEARWRAAGATDAEIATIIAWRDLTASTAPGFDLLTAASYSEADMIVQLELWRQTGGPLQAAAPPANNRPAPAPAPAPEAAPAPA